MTDQWITLLIQVPLVGVFVWYSLKMAEQSRESYERFLEALDKRDEAFERRNKDLKDALADISKMQADHDVYVHEMLGKRVRSQRQRAHEEGTE